MEMTKLQKEELKHSGSSTQVVKETVKSYEERKRLNHQSLNYNRDKDREMVRGKFIFHEVPGGCMSFVFKAYKGDEVERYDMVDGHIYTVPLGVAKHLNKNLWYPEYSYVKSEQVYNGFGPNQAMKATRKVKRCSFQSLEFLDIDEVPTNVSPIIQVENI
jgi:hypothetical protein